MSLRVLRASVLNFLLPATAAFVAGCATFEGHPAAVPFFEVFQDPEDLPPPSLSPFTIAPLPQESPPPHDSRPPAGKEYVLRPFGSYAVHGRDGSALKILWPLLDFHRDSGEVRQRIIPVWYRQKKSDISGGPNDRWMLFPILAGGRVAEKGNYFAFFPFAGKVLGILGREETSFFAFPAYARVRNKGSDSVHILWPFFNRIRGGGRDGLRIWPFYGRFKEESEDGRPRYDRTFYMWPFFIRQENELHTLHPSKLVFFFPFYGKNESDITLTRTILWPIFHSTLDKRTGKKLLFGFLFPYRFHEGQFDLWPLFGVKRWDFREVIPSGSEYRKFRQFFLWPIERYAREEDERFIAKRFWIIPFYWRFWQLRKEDRAEELEWKIWPLVRYHRVEGDASLYILSLLPFRQEVPFERLYARLWRLFLYRDTPTWSGWEALFTILSYRKEKIEGVRTFRVLGGLFERQATPEGSRFRFFYLPWRSTG